MNSMQATARKMNSIPSFISILFLWIVGLSSKRTDNDLFESLLTSTIELLLPWCMAQNYNIRLYGQVTTHPSTKVQLLILICRLLCWEYLPFVPNLDWLMLWTRLEFWSKVSSPVSSSRVEWKMPCGPRKTFSSASLIPLAISPLR